MTPKHRQRGFTLLEVMVALAVFAVAAIALLLQSNQGVNQTLYLEEKSYALWIAENQLDQLRLNKQWPALGKRPSSVTQFNRNWSVSTSVTGTDEKSLRRVEVTVSREGSHTALATLLSYIGQY